MCMSLTLPNGLSLSHDYNYTTEQKNVVKFGTLEKHNELCDHAAGFKLHVTDVTMIQIPCQMIVVS